jgi:hypothetical protein
MTWSSAGRGSRPIPKAQTVVGLPAGHGFAAIRKAAYFRELLSAVNSALILVSIPAIAARIPSAMPVAIRHYSIAVAPVSSAMNLRAAFTGGR